MQTEFESGDVVSVADLCSKWLDRLLIRDSQSLIGLGTFDDWLGSFTKSTYALSLLNIVLSRCSLQ